IQAARRLDIRPDPATTTLVPNPVGGRARHDRQAAVGPKLALRSEAMRRDDNGHQLCRANRPKSGAGLDLLRDRMPPRFPNQIGVGAIVKLRQRVELVVQRFGRPSLALRELPKPRRPSLLSVYIRIWRRHTT